MPIELTQRDTPMVGTRLHWVEGPWPGRLAVAARPRGGDWLEDEITGWKLQRVETVVSFLERKEEEDLELVREGAVVRAEGMRFRSFPIADRQSPNSQSALASLIDQVDTELAGGRNVVLHCRQGVGRAGLVAASLMVARGLDPEAAVERVSTARGISIPETAEQRDWIEHFAETLAQAR